ncbi:MAG: hypothetical protein DRP90_01815 [Planctomycetota bacterium]|nr:MAG: hypothetical protein DRP90_01815 [Planctomycetota bacterium]
MEVTTVNEDLGRALLERVMSIPNGHKIKACQQCGACSASCPSSYAMEYSPREIIAALRAGVLNRVFESSTVWLCASCYLCTVRCPAGIPFTDVMYELKAMGIEKGLYKKDQHNIKMARTFTRTVEKYGRNAEVEMILKYYLTTNPLKLLGQTSLALKLLMKGRLDLFPHRIKGLAELKKMVAAVEGGSNGS